MAEHAKCSASGSHRWMKCTKSIQLESNLPESRSSYAEEGSYGHAVAEWKLRKYLKLKAGKKPVHREYDSKELEDAVDTYVNLAIEKISEARARSKDALIVVEIRVDFSRWVTEGFGTCDLLTVSDGALEIIDLKMGKGVLVEAQNNPQLMIYALGALEMFQELYGVEVIRMHISQPRLNEGLSSWELSTEELLKWAEEELKPKAELAYNGEGSFVAGEHCRFCRAKAVCRERAQVNLDLAKYDFEDPEVLSDDEVSEILSKAEQLQSWAKDIWEYAQTEAVSGRKKWAGFKVVEGRSNRKYTDEDKVVEAILNTGDYTEDAIYNKKLIGITDMERLIGKKTFKELLDDLIEKPAGKPALVPETDKRCEWNSAVADFK
jgi:hypothetical protein